MNANSENKCKENNTATKTEWLRFERDIRKQDRKKDNPTRKI